MQEGTTQNQLQISGWQWDLDSIFVFFCFIFQNSLLQSTLQQPLRKQLGIEGWAKF